MMTTGARLGAASAAACLLLVSGCGEGMALRQTIGAAGAAAHADAMEDPATVVRVVDGDTIVVTVDDRTTTVRLLNVDTPETKDPHQRVQCLGPEASAFLTRRLPAGTEVSLQYDTARTDRYERVLAGVFEGGSLINAEIARKGLGVAVLFEPNRRFLAEVEAAEQEARDARRGLFGEDVSCTLPAQVSAMSAALAELADQQPTTSDAAAASAAAAATLIGDADRLHRGLMDGSVVRGSVLLIAYDGELRTSLARTLRRNVGEASVEQRRLASRAKTLKAEEKRRAEEKRKAEEKRAAERRAAERAAEQRAAEERAEERRAAERQRAEAAEQQRQTTPTPPKTSTPKKSKKKEQSSGSSNPYPGYTGPRCYAPGGKTWKPC